MVKKVKKLTGLRQDLLAMEQLVFSALCVWGGGGSFTT